MTQEDKNHAKWIDDKVSNTNSETRVKPQADNNTFAPMDDVA